MTAIIAVNFNEYTSVYVLMFYKVQSKIVLLQEDR
jgi:hypothetical protein